MNEKYTDAFIDSSIEYLRKLSYLANQDAGTLKDISLLEVFLQVYNWTDWFEVSENNKIKIQKLLDCIYLRNPNLSLPKVIPGTFYSNVSTPQTIWTWQRVWDNIDSITEGGIPIEYYLNVTPLTTSVHSLTGTTSFAVSSNVVWTATSSQPWCSITSTTSGLINITYATNILSEVRTAFITVSGPGVTTVTLVLIQAGTTATLSVTPSLRTVAAIAGSTTFSLVTNSSWTAVSDSAWCAVTLSGTGNGIITATYPLNLGTSIRTANITVTAPGSTPIVVQVVQQASSVYLEVAPSLQSVSASSGTTIFAVTSNTSWVTALVGNATDWCSATPSGANNGTIIVTYTQNTNVASRSVTLVTTAVGLTPISVTVTQAGTAPTLTVYPLTGSVSNVAGIIDFAVTSNSAWSVTSNADWCSVNFSGSGNGSISARYLENTLGTQRVATITVTVAGLTPVDITLTQAAAVGFGPVEVHQGYIYTWSVLNGASSITSSNDWVIPTISFSEILNPLAEYSKLQLFADPNYNDLLVYDTNAYNFSAYVTYGRTATGVFHAPGLYPEGSILLSPYMNSGAVTPMATFIGMLGHAWSMTSYSISKASFPLRLVRTSTSLTPGQTGYYTGNNGVLYRTICVGTVEAPQEWLAENLIETNFRNGSNIPEIQGNTDWATAITNNTPARCSYNNDETNAFIPQPD